MRVTDSVQFSNFLNRIQKLYTDFFTYNEQVVSGKRINRPSDDPVGSTMLAAVKSELASLSQYIENIHEASNRLSSSDARLNDVSLAMTRVIQLNEQAANEPTAGQPRRGIAQEVFSITQEILGHADSQVGGRFLFSGTRNTLDSLMLVTNNPEGRVYSAAAVGITDNGSAGTITGVMPDPRYFNEHIHQIEILNGAGDYQIVDLDSSDQVVATGTFTAPGDTVSVNGIDFTYTGGALAAGDVFTVVPQYAYNGTSDNIEMQVDESTRTIQNVRGTDPFGGTEPSPAGIQVPGGTLFDDLVELRRALLTDDQPAIQLSLDTMFGEHDDLGEVRANLGGRMSNLESLDLRNQAEAADLIVQVANIENVNLAEAITNLAQTESGLQAALQAGARIGQLNLFNYIG